jgi:hypothetical protein
MAKQRLIEGEKVKMIEEGNIIDEGIVRRVGANEIEVESLNLYPGKRTEFAFFQQAKGYSWCMLFKDPMTGKRCLNTRGPNYLFEPI